MNAAMTVPGPKKIPSGRPYQQCTRCVMDTSDPGITFNEMGQCDQCVSFFRDIVPHWHTDERGRRELDALADKIRKEGEGKDFDCIMGMSGGVDSSYLAWVSKEVLGLRPLIFHVDAGWNSQLAVNNIEKIVDGLGLDLFTVVIDWEEMRDLQLAYFRAGVPHIDNPQDHSYIATLYRFAEEHKLKYILNGGNNATEGIRNPLEYFYYGTDLRQIRDIHSQFGDRPLKHYPLSGILRHKLYLRYVKGVQLIKPLDYLPYQKADAMKFLSERFGWLPYPQKHFESRFTKFYEGYWLPTKFGFDVRRVQFSSLIVSNQMTRAEALEQLQRPPYDPDTIAQDFEYVAKKLGITFDELRSYHDAPNKSYRDYKNTTWMFDMGARVMHALRLDARVGKR